MEDKRLKALKVFQSSKVILDDMNTKRASYSAAALSWRCLDILIIQNQAMLELLEEPEEELDMEVGQKQDDPITDEEPTSEEDLPVPASGQDEDMPQESPVEENYDAGSDPALAHETQNEDVPSEEFETKKSEDKLPEEEEEIRKDEEEINEYAAEEFEDDEDFEEEEESKEETKG